MNRQKQIDQFAKLSAYMLGRHPEEFGLVPDNDGYIKIKEFIQAITEIDGYRHIRKNHINEMMLVHPDPPIEVTETRIRAKDHSMLSKYMVCDNPPGLLYTCVRQKSYLSVLNNGIRPTAHAKIICCKDPDMAQRIGKRRSPQPILLTIHTKNLLEQGMTFLHLEDLLYLTGFIPTDCFTGPAPPKENPAAKKTDKKPDPIEAYKQQSQGGTFTFSMKKLAGKKFKGKKKEKDDSWKNNKKRLRREKKYSWPDQ
jgi:putative RNA 2'-phosphotransferase